MHEASLARRILDLVEDAAGGPPPRRAAVVHVRVGAFQSVVPSALAFAFEALRAGTAAESARLELTIEPVVLRCATCGDLPLVDTEFTPFCPSCGAVADPIAGRDLVLSAITFASDP